MRVRYFGTYRAEYSRNQIMIEGLRRAGVEVIECHETLWHGIEDRVQVTSGGWISPAFLWRVLRTYGHLLAKYLKMGPYDIMVVGYPGQFDVYLARTPDPFAPKASGLGYLYVHLPDRARKKTGSKKFAYPEAVGLGGNDCL